MLNEMFYHGHIRKLISAFGQIFSDIKIAAVDGSGTITKVSTVPLRYAGTDKTLLKDINLNKPFGQIYPRMSYEVTNINYDPDKKTNPLNRIKNIPSPTPYNVEFSLYIISRNGSDALQIIEQILPYFNPTLTFSMKNSPMEGLDQDVPLTFTGTSLSDDYEGDEDTPRRVEWVLNFTAQLSFFKGVNSSYENQLAEFVEKHYDPSDPTSCSPPRKRILRTDNRIEKVIINEYPEIFDIPPMFSSENLDITSTFIRDLFLNNNDKDTSTPTTPPVEESTQDYMVYTKNGSEMTWVIEHNRGKRPVVAVYDTTGTILDAQIRTSADFNTIEILFNEPMSGVAILSW